MFQNKCSEINVPWRLLKFSANLPHIEPENDFIFQFFGVHSKISNTSEIVTPCSCVDLKRCGCVHMEEI